MTYTTRHHRPGSGTYATDVLTWRAKQLVTAGYSVTDVAGWIGCPLVVAEAAFADAYPEMAG